MEREDRTVTIIPTIMQDQATVLDITIRVELVIPGQPRSPISTVDIVYTLARETSILTRQ